MSRDLLKDMNKKYYVYIMANERPTLYIGVTNNLGRRVWEHKEGLVKGFTKRYHLHKLIYYEVFEEISNAIVREKQLKRFRRREKLNLKKSYNPKLKDLYGEIIT